MKLSKLIDYILQKPEWARRRSQNVASPRAFSRGSGYGRLRREAIFACERCHKEAPQFNIRAVSMTQR